MISDNYKESIDKIAVRSRYPLNAYISYEYHFSFIDIRHAKRNNKTMGCKRRYRTTYPFISGGISFAPSRYQFIIHPIRSIKTYMIKNEPIRRHKKYTSVNSGMRRFRG